MKSLSLLAWRIASKSLALNVILAIALVVSSSLALVKWKLSIVFFEEANDKRSVELTNKVDIFPLYLHFSELYISIL